jgi:hypothetical protein
MWQIEKYKLIVGMKFEIRHVQKLRVQKVHKSNGFMSRFSYLRSSVLLSVRSGRALARSGRYPLEL